MLIHPGIFLCPFGQAALTELFLHPFVVFYDRLLLRSAVAAILRADQDRFS